jgi:hypothetical protein
LAKKIIKRVNKWSSQKAGRVTEEAEKDKVRKYAPFL